MSASTVLDGNGCNDTAHDRIMRILLGRLAGQVAAALVELGIADRMDGSTAAGSELAAQLRLHDDHLSRLLRAAAAIGLVAEKEGGFVLTTLGARLRADHPESLAPLARFLTSTHVQATSAALAESIQSGETAIGRHSVFEVLAGDPALGVLFDAAMTSVSNSIGPAVAKAYAFEGLCIDIGGGEGAMLAHILTAHPQARGLLYELPAIAAKARAFMARRGLSERCAVTSGDMFAEIPSGGRTYLMSAVLHDWDDARSLAILANCRRAMSSDAQLLIIERVVGDSPPETAKAQVDALSDLNMMLRTGGRERREDEWAALLARTGFRLRRTIRASPRSILECVPE